MKRLALISDIHGNGVALDAVLAEMTRWRVDEIICLGDLAVGGPQPQAVIACLRELDCRSVRGNAEGWLLDGLPPGRSEETRRLGEIVAWTRAALSRGDLEYLAGLPPTLTVRADGVTLVCFHGSPRSEIEALLATTPARELEDALAGVPAAHLLAGGHTHLQLSRQCGDRLLVNPGSVGLPLGSLTEAAARLPAWAEYAVVEMGGGEIRIFLQRVAVKVEALAAATAVMPHASWAADLERRIRRWNARAR
jgi:putative phosphoesterase